MLIIITIEPTLSQVWNGWVDESLTGITCAWHFLELLSSKRPTSDGKKNLTLNNESKLNALDLKESLAHLKTWVRLLESDDSRVQSNFSIFRFVVAFKRAQFSFLQPTEGEDDVRAEISWYVLWGELAELHAILRPVCVVADDFVSVLVLLVAFFDGCNFNICCCGSSQHSGSFSGSNLKPVCRWRWGQIWSVLSWFFNWRRAWCSCYISKRSFAFFKLH